MFTPLQSDLEERMRRLGARRQTAERDITRETRRAAATLEVSAHVIQATLQGAAATVRCRSAAAASFLYLHRVEFQQRLSEQLFIAVRNVRLRT
ncbi:hypothetical protein HYZ80_04045 [Candidatus Parcubacteria bacterium]|nr:hypothetical protein [Candidatus Parcubacteria bacterium]